MNSPQSCSATHNGGAWLHLNPNSHSPPFCRAAYPRSLNDLKSARYDISSTCDNFLKVTRDQHFIPGQSDNAGITIVIKLHRSPVLNKRCKSYTVKRTGKGEKSTYTETLDKNSYWSCSSLCHMM